MIFSYFQPACFLMLFSVPAGMSLSGCLTDQATVPRRVMADDDDDDYPLEPKPVSWGRVVGASACGAIIVGSAPASGTLRG